jgi:hypothetical protein
VREGGVVPLLEGLVEGAVPRVQEHQDVQGAEVEDDDEGEEGSAPRRSSDRQ